MKVERWDPKKHMSLLDEWVRGWDISGDAGPACMYPPTGYVVDDCVLGHLFVFRDVPVGHLGGIISDPGALKERRRMAIEMLVATLLEEANRLELVEVRSAPKDNNRLSNVLSGHGFHWIADCRFMSYVNRSHLKCL